MGLKQIVHIGVQQRRTNTMMKILTLLAFLAVATALPSTSSIVPEWDGLDTTLLEVNAFDEAKATVESMIQAGKDEGACADLAAASIKEVEDAVDSNQKILDGLDTGADCPNKGQSAVDAAQSALDNAQNEKQSADAAAAAAASASVDFGSVPLSSLSPGQCDVFFNGAAYTSAVATKESTANAAIQAGAAVTAAEAGLKAAQEAQQDAIAECQCAAKKAYEAAWEAANANNDANEKAYTKGKHMQCVLEGTPPGSCQVGAIPKVTAITLADGVESASCNSHNSHTVTCDLTIDNTMTSVKYNGKELSVSGPKGNWNANKHIQFDTVTGGVLEVTGHDSEGNNFGHCKTAGFAIQCQSEDTFWGSFNSGSSAIQAAGGNDVNGNSFTDFHHPCITTSGFSLPANRALKKLWAPEGERWAKFQMGPTIEAAPAPAPAPPALVAGNGAGSSCAMHDKHNNQGSITGTGCGSGYHGCHVKANGWAKIANSGGCCSGSGFHRRCHCSTNANVDCQAMCQKDSGCIGWVTANHGCQWATISSGC